MEYRWTLKLGLVSSCLLHCVIVFMCPSNVLGQTEGDTGYDYGEAYDDYDDDSGIEPTFDVPIVNVTVVAGQTAVLPCSIESLGKYKVAWLDQKNMALTFDDRRFIDDVRFSVVRPYMKEWNLQIQDVCWEDQGQYRCTINTEPAKSKSVVLHVKVPAQIIDALSTGDVTVQEGDTVVLVCNVTGVPRPEVTWYRRPAISNTNERQSKMCHKPRTHGPGIGHVGEVIIIQNVSRYCDDIYECVADNGVPPAVSRQMSVTVEFAPEIMMNNNRISQEVGKNTILECMITAYPHAGTDWRKDGREISSHPGKYRVQPYDDGQHRMTLSLSINNLTEEDYGMYECRAENALGTDSETMILDKPPLPPKIKPETRPPNTEKGTYSPFPEEPKPSYTVKNKANGYDKAKTREQKSLGSPTTNTRATLSLVVPVILLFARHFSSAICLPL